MLEGFGGTRSLDIPVRGPSVLQAPVGVLFWWWPLTGLSWLPFALAGGPPLSFRHHPSHSSIGDEFKWG